MAVSKALRFQILRRDGHACRYCGRTAPEVKCQQGCVGHLMWCEDHVTQAVDGELTKEGKPYTIAEFTEDTVD